MLVKLWLNPSFGQLPHISLCRLVLLFVLERKLLCILYSETILNELMENRCYANTGFLFSLNLLSISAVPRIFITRRPLTPPDISNPVP